MHTTVHMNTGTAGTYRTSNKQEVVSRNDGVSNGGQLGPSSVNNV